MRKFHLFLIIQFTLFYSTYSQDVMNERDSSILLSKKITDLNLEIISCKPRLQVYNLASKVPSFIPKFKKTCLETIDESLNLIRPDDPRHLYLIEIMTILGNIKETGGLSQNQAKHQESQLISIIAYNDLLMTLNFQLETFKEFERQQNLIGGQLVETQDKIDSFKLILDQNIIPMSKKISKIDTNLMEMDTSIQENMIAIEKSSTTHALFYLGTGMNFNTNESKDCVCSYRLPIKLVFDKPTSEGKLHLALSTSYFYITNSSDELGITATTGLFYQFGVSRLHGLGVELGGSKVSNNPTKLMIEVNYILKDSFMFGMNYDVFRGFGLQLHLPINRPVNYVFAKDGSLQMFGKNLKNNTHVFINSVKFDKIIGKPEEKKSKEIK